MATRKKEGKKTKPAPKSIRELIRKAREQGHDTLGLTSDPDALGALEFIVLVRILTERLAAKFERGYGPYTDAVGSIMWEPGANCVVRVMIRYLCEGMRATTDDGSVSYDDSDLYAAARSVLGSVHTRLGDDWTGAANGRFSQVAIVVADVFRGAERFSFPTQFTCRGVPYIFHRKSNRLHVTRGDR